MAGGKKYFIYAGGTRIGWSRLEHGDPPMSVAFGIFHLGEAYGELAPLFQKLFVLPSDADERLKDVHVQVENLNLRAETITGISLEPCSRVYIDDPTTLIATDDELTKDDYELLVHVCGLEAKVYEHHFSHHLASYQSSFGDQHSRR